MKKMTDSLMSEHFVDDNKMVKSAAGGRAVASYESCLRHSLYILTLKPGLKSGLTR